MADAIILDFPFMVNFSKFHIALFAVAHSYVGYNVADSLCNDSGLSGLFQFSYLDEQLCSESKGRGL